MKYQELTEKGLHQAINDNGYKISLPRVILAMGELEDSGLIKGKYDPYTKEGVLRNRKLHWLTKAGKKAAKEIAQ